MFSIPWALGAAASAAAPSGRSARSAASMSVKMTEVADQDLGGVLDRVLRRHRAVGGHLELQLVEVGALADAGGVDVVRHAPHGREDRVDGDDADRRLGALVALGRHVAAAAGDRQRHLEPGLLGQVADDQVGVQDLEVGRRLDVGRRDRAGAVLLHLHLDLAGLAVEPADEALEVEDDVGHVLADARHRRELVGDALDLDRGDGGSLERREEHAPQAVAERVAEPAVERLDDERAKRLADVFGRDLRNDLKHRLGLASLGWGQSATRGRPRGDCRYLE